MTYDEVPQQNGDGHFADGWYVDGSLLLDRGAIKVLVRRKIYAGCAVPDELCRHLVRLNWHTGDDDIAKRKALFEAPSLLVLDLVAVLLDALATGEELHTSDVNGIDGSAVVGQESSQRSAIDLGSVDDGDGLAKETVASGQDGVVDLQVLKNLDACQWGARQDGLFAVLGGIQESDIVVHVVQVLVAHALDVFCQVDGFLDILIMCWVLGEDGIVHNDTIDILLLVCLHNGLFKDVLFHITQVKLEATMNSNFCQLMNTKNTVEDKLDIAHRWTIVRWS
jgi:hypothetical protein